MNEHDLKEYLEAKRIADSLAAAANDPGKGLPKGLPVDDPEVAPLLERFSDPEIVEGIYHEFSDIGSKHPAATERLMTLARKKRRARSLRQAVAWSASAAACVAAVLLLVFDGGGEPTVVADSHPTVPVLITGSGGSIDLVVGKIDDAAIRHDRERLDYTAAAADSVAEFHTLIVPAMYTYSVTLPDGTDVKLNANSRLRYPKAFVGDRREVSLEGEAFFDVAHDEKPFIVKSYDVGVRVYGTRFNVDSYDPGLIKTMLAEGSVGVSGNRIAERMIKPGQLATVNTAAGEMYVEHVDTTLYSAWVDGILRFEKDDIHNALARLTNWYGVEFSVARGVGGEITGSFGNTVPLDEILYVISVVTDTKFTERGGAWYVEKRKR